MPDANLAQVYNYFKSTYADVGGMSQFRKEWGELTEQDKTDLKQGIGDGSLTY